MAGAMSAREAAAQTMENVLISGPGGTQLLARVYKPANPTSGMPGAVLLHGCSGMWSNSVPPDITCTATPCTVGQTKYAQSHIEKWGRQLASHGYWAIAVDSFTTREKGTQYQCGGGGEVNPYITRPKDFYAGKDHLLATFDAAEQGVAVIGWSQGAEAALITAAETPRDSDTTYCSMGVSACEARAEDRPAAAVIFYPGCGADLGFGYEKGTGTAANPQDPGYFRPDIPVRWNHGTGDTTVPIGACQARIDEAIATYASDITLDAYAGAAHSFDMNPGTTNAERWAFPTTKCDAAELANTANADLCARRDADIDSWAFITANVSGD
ncbi:dienelactone hydrolase [Minicystis rosea]|nr:dienelactone hydrolase [Minicystis rosea]